MENNIVYDIGPANGYVKWAFSRLRYVPATAKDMFRQDGVWPDLCHELYAAGYESWQQNLTIQQTRNYAARRIRLFFRQYGYRQHRFTLFRQEIPFALFSVQCHDGDVAEYLMTPTKFPKQDHGPDSCSLRHTEEKLFATLKRHPQGLNRYIISKRLGLEIQETQHLLDKLVAENKIVCVERDNSKGTRVASRISPVYFIAGAEIPQRSIRNEVTGTIRYAYFVEHKTRHQIHKEIGRNYYTILKAVQTAPPELVDSTV